MDINQQPGDYSVHRQITQKQIHDHAIARDR